MTVRRDNRVVVGRNVFAFDRNLFTGGHRDGQVIEIAFRVNR